MRNALVVRLAAALSAIFAASCTGASGESGGAPSKALAAPASAFFNDVYLPNAAGIFFDDSASGGASFGGGVGASRIGATTFFSDGVSATRIGGATFFSNGVTASTYGDTVLFSDGRFCVRSGTGLNCY